MPKKWLIDLEDYGRYGSNTEDQAWPLFMGLLAIAERLEVIAEFYAPLNDNEREIKIGGTDPD